MSAFRERLSGADRLAAYVGALVLVAAVSVLVGMVEGRVRIPNVSMLYLIAVLAAATLFGRGPAIATAIVAFLTFDWFFIEPLHTLTIAGPEEWLALLLFLVTATITGQLAADQRRRAEEARLREREALLLYEVVRGLADEDLERSFASVAERIHRALHLSAVRVEIDGSGATAPYRVAFGDADALELAARAQAGPAQLLREERGAGTGPSWIRRLPPHPPGARISADVGRVHLVALGQPDRPHGTLALVRAKGAPPFGKADGRLLSAIAAQLTAAVERARLRRIATETEVLQRTDQLKSALLAAVSHDLRTPLASIIASAGSLRQAELTWSDAERDAFLADIEHEARRLNRIVGNLLDLSRMEAGGLRPERAWYDLGALVDDVLGRLRTVTSGRRLVVTIPDDLPPVLLDYVEIDQVLSNLIENAVRYGPSGSEIAVAVRIADGEVRIAVADRGPGVPSEARERIFEPFYRVPVRPGPGGIGLGLAVAKGLVEAHGGRIWVAERTDGGSVFTVALPAREPDARPVEAQVVRA